MTVKKLNTSKPRKPGDRLPHKVESPLKPAQAKRKGKKAKPLNLALQGGAAHGAFTWGVLDHLLADERLEIEAISATSAGAMNAAVMVCGLLQGGPAKARDLLAGFWRRVSMAGRWSPFKPMPGEDWLVQMGLPFTPSTMMSEYMTRTFSPYQLNMFNYNPLREILEETVDFDLLRRNKHIKLFVNATNVRTGKIRIFETKDISLDVIMASACLPYLYKAVEIDGEAYWDGGFTGNPAIYPLIYRAGIEDVLIVQINPLYVKEVPKSATEILDRMNEISFNSSLMREMRAVAFVTKLIDEDTNLREDYKRMRVHMIEAEEHLGNLNYASKMNTDWDFLIHLHQVGLLTAKEWLAKHYDKLGVESTVDIWKQFL